MDFVALIFMIFLMAFTVFLEDSFTPQSIGILLTYALNLQISLFYLLSMFGNFSNLIISMERCLSFTNIESEKHLELHEDKNLALTNWPQFGKIEFKNYSVRYRPDTELILKNITLSIQGKEKIGVVGRTGSGKSTICLALFRLLEPSNGTIIIDGVDITKIGLRALRKQLTIIPQDPSLVKGTLKYNIDPLGLRSDNEIQSVINAIGLCYLANNNDNGLSMLVNIIYNIKNNTIIDF